jgi:hypothetical protein
MRTTVAIEDHLLSSARLRARQRGLTLGQLVEQALRSELARDETSAEGPPVPVFAGGGGLRRGVDAASTRALLEALDEGQPLERLR